MKYISITSVDRKATQYIPLSYLSTVSYIEGMWYFVFAGRIPPEKAHVSTGLYKTNSFSLYRTIKECGIPISFSIF